MNRGIRNLCSIKPNEALVGATVSLWPEASAAIANAFGFKSGGTSEGQRNRGVRRRRAIPLQCATWPVSRVLYGPDALRRHDVAAILLGRILPSASRNQPGWRAGNSPREFPLAPSLFGFAPGGVCHAAPVASRAVGSYPTLSPLHRRSPKAKACGLLSVALSLGSPPPAINRHRVSMEPGLSSPAAFRLLPVRPPGRLAIRIKVFEAENANEKARLTAGFHGFAFR